MPLTIYNKHINKISGPVSLQVLRPNKTKFDEYKKNGMTLPIYILFGDVHNSTKNMCEICECKDGSSSCCYKVYDPNFMRLIDKVVSPGHSVDLYTEQWEHHLTENENLSKYKGLGPLHYMSEPYAVCYNRKLKKTEQYTKGCPTKGLKWHSADVRKARYSKKEKETFEMFCTYLALCDPSYEFLYSIEIRNIQKTFNNIISIFSKEQIKKYCDVINNLINEKPAMRLLSPQESVIVKQISKFPAETQDIWLKRVDKYIYTNVFNISVNRKKIWQKVLQKIDEYVPATENNQYTSYFDKYFSERENKSSTSHTLSDLELLYNEVQVFKLCTALVDCYFICRSIKSVKNDPSVLAISYLGDFHIQDISKFLVDELEYEMVFKHSTGIDNMVNPTLLQGKNVSRCIEIIPDINIDNMLKEYGYKIPDTGPTVPLPFDAPQTSYNIYDTAKPTSPRSPNGSQLNKKTGDCKKSSDKRSSSTSPRSPKGSRNNKKTSNRSSSRKPRCPKGERRNKLTGVCEPYKK
jgi:hypothetical protein